MQCNKCGEKNHHLTEDHFLPVNHAYNEHSTYTGPGCVLCGKPAERHRPAKTKETQPE